MTSQKRVQIPLNPNYGSTLTISKIKTGIFETSILLEDTTSCTSPASSLSSEIELLSIDEESPNDNNFSTIAQQTGTTRHRLHCLFVILSCLILPIAVILFGICLIILYMYVFIAIFDSHSHHCSKLQMYAFISAFLLLYNIFDGRVKNIISRFSRSSNEIYFNNNSTGYSINSMQDLFHLVMYLAYVYLGAEWTGLLEFSDSDTIYCDTTCSHLCFAAKNYVLAFSTLATSLILISIFTCYGECYGQQLYDFPSMEII